MSINPSSLYKNEAIRYCLVGGVNTAITAAVIFGLTVFGFGLYSSNASGYVVGILFSYFLNTYFTFSSKASLCRLTKFITCCLVCYIINIIAMKLAMLIGVENYYYIQINGMFFYTVSGYLINKLWVMK